MHPKFGSLFFLLSIFLGFARISAQNPELVIQSGHYEKINALAFSPDGQTLASASQDEKVIIWDVASGKEFRKLIGHKKEVSSVIFTADNQILISGGGRLDPSLIFWDWKKGSPLHKIDKAHSNAIEAVALSPDGKMLITSTYRELKAWNVNTYELLFEIESRGKSFNDLLIRHTVNDIAFSPDGKTFAVGTAAKRLHIFNSADFKLLQTIDLKGSESLAQTLAFSNNGKTLYHSGSMDQIVARDARSGELTQSWEGIGSGSPCPCQIAPRTALVLTGCGGKLRLQSLKDGKKMLEGEYFSSNSALALGPREKVIALAGTTIDQFHQIKLIDSKNGALIQTLKGYPGKITSLDFHPENHKLASGSRQRNTRIWDISSTSGILNFLDGTFSKRGDIYSTVAFSPDGQALLNGTQSAIFIWDADNSQLKQRIFQRGKEVGNLKVHPQGDVIFNTHYIKVINPDNGEEIKDLGPARLATRSVAISADGRTIYAGGFKEIKRWAYPSFDEIEKIETDHYTWEMALSSDQKYLMTNGGRTMYLRDQKTGALIRKISEQNERNLVFSPDNQLFASSAEDTIYLRSTGDFKIIRKLIGHEDRVSALTFSPDNRVLASGSDDTSIKLWEVKTGKLLATLIALDEEDFIITTPELFYMTSKDGLKGVAFRVGDKIFPFDQFDLKYNRPDKVLEKIGYASPRVLDLLKRAYEKRLRRLNFNEQMFNDDFHLPEIELLNPSLPLNSKEKMLALEIQARDSKYNLDRLQIYVNDNPIFGRSGLDLRSKKSQDYKKKFNLELNNGPNIIQLSVLNAKGVESLRKTLQINYTGATGPSNLYLLSIGVSEFANPKMNLNYAQKDAQDLVALFQASKEKAYQEIIIKELYNEDAVLKNILALKETLKKTQVDDKVVLFMASHGLLNEQLDYYLATHDVNFKKPSEKGLIYESLENLLDEIPARSKVLMIDACHSGEIDKDDQLAFVDNTSDGTVRARGFGVADTEIKDEEDVEDMDLDFDVGEIKQVGLKSSFEIMKEIFADLRKGTGSTVISSAGGLEYALEGDVWNNGVFTYSVLTGLKNKKADLDNDGQVLLSELKQYLQIEVPKLTDGRQKPTSRIENISNDFRIW